jgi:putative nucleotidyltransferase with HDIG domain
MFVMGWGIEILFFTWLSVKDDLLMNPELFSSNNSQPESLIHRLWRRLVAPSPHIKEKDQRRQATLLSTLLLALIFLTLALELIGIALYGWEYYTSDQVAIVTTGVLTIIYVISRTRYARVAAILAIIAILIAIFIAGWIYPDWVFAGLFDFILVPIWLGSLYLSSGGLMILVIANLIALIAFPLLAPEIPLDFILIAPFGFILVTSILTILLTRHRNLLEQDRRAELAEKEQRSRLEAARTRALLRVAERLNAQLDLDILLTALSEEVIQALNTPASIVMLYDQKQNILYPETGLGISPDLIKSISSFPKSTYDEAVKELGAVFALPDMQVLPSVSYILEFKRLNFRSIAFATMEYAHELIGSLNAITLGERREFTEDELLLLRGIADQAALAVVNTRLYKDARRRLEHLQALRAIDTAIVSNHDLRNTLDVLLEQISRQLEVDAGVILILDKNRQHLEYAASRGFNTPTLRFTRLRLGEGIAGRAAQQRKIIRIDDLRTDPQTLSSSPTLAREGFASYFAAPLLAQGQVTGVLEIFHRSLLDPDQEWLNFLETLAGQAAIAIESTSLFADLQQMNEELIKAYDSTIEGWSHALDLRDKETEGHTLRVTELTLELARAFGFGEAELVHVRRGALLHDIGKMGIPDRILLKEGPLTPDEWEIMRKHPVYAHEMLLPIEYLRQTLDIPYCHHEKWDGSGYPRGLKGEEIPLIARIFAVIDVWDAVTSDRPYRPAWSREKALAHIQEQISTHFDPHVVEVFLGLIKQKQAVIDDPSGE